MMSSPEQPAECQPGTDSANQTPDDTQIDKPAALHTISLESQQEGDKEKAVPEAISTRQSDKSPTTTKAPVFNPYEYETKRFNQSTINVYDTLNTSALEIFLEFFGMTRVGLFGRTEYLAAIYNEGTQPGSWQFLDSGDPMPSGPYMRCLKRFRLPAATEIDRSETYRVCLFAPENIPNEEQQRQRQFTVSEQNAWAYAQFKVAEALECKPMILDRRLTYTRTEALAKGRVSITFDFIHPLDVANQPQRIHFDFGFNEGSPRRNRIYFELAKALKRGKWCPVFKSEVRCFEDLAKFDLVTVDSQDLSGGDPGRMVRLELYRWYKNGKTKLLGFVQTTFDKLVTLRANDQLYWWPAEDGISAAKVVVKQARTLEGEFTLSLRMTSMF